MDFTAAKISSTKVAAPGMSLVHVDVGPSIASGYTKGGQYIQVKVADADKAGFFAIASAPAESKSGNLELLIKTQPGSTAESICKLSEGAEVLVSPVQGKGYAVETVPEAASVVLVATGSGISPIKAVIESGALSKAKVHLFYGTKSKEMTAFQDLIPKWEAAGVTVTQVFSGDSQHYVQHELKAQVEAGKVTAQAVLLCGHKDMCNEVKEIMGAAGVAPEAMLMNF